MFVLNQNHRVRLKVLKLAKQVDRDVINAALDAAEMDALDAAEIAEEMGGFDEDGLLFDSGFDDALRSPLSGGWSDDEIYLDDDY